MQKQNKMWLVSVSMVLLLVGMVGLTWLGPASPPVAAQTAGASSRTLTVVGEGMVTIKPDVAQVNVGVEVVDTDLQAANSQAGTVMDDIMAGLKGQGISDSDMQTSNFNIWLERPYVDGAPSDKVLYHVSNQVNVTITDLDKVGDILDTAIKAGANNIYGVTFSLANPSQVQAEGRDKAISDARAKAEALAKLSDGTLGEIISVSEVIGNIGYSNSLQLFAQGGGGGGPVTPGELKVTQQLQVVFALQ